MWPGNVFPKELFNLLAHSISNAEKLFLMAAKGAGQQVQYSVLKYWLELPPPSVPWEPPNKSNPFFKNQNFFTGFFWETLTGLNFLCWHTPWWAPVHQWWTTCLHFLNAKYFNDRRKFRVQDARMKKGVCRRAVEMLLVQWWKWNWPLFCGLWIVIERFSPVLGGFLLLWRNCSSSFKNKLGLGLFQSWPGT